MMITAPDSGTVSWTIPILLPGPPPSPGPVPLLSTRPLVTPGLVTRGSLPRPPLYCRPRPPCHISLQFRDRASMAIIIMILKAQHFTTLADLHHFCLTRIHPQTPTFSLWVVAVTLGEVREASGVTGEDLVRDSLVLPGSRGPLEADSVIMTTVIEGA